MNNPFSKRIPGPIREWCVSISHVEGAHESYGRGPFSTKDAGLECVATARGVNPASTVHCHPVYSPLDFHRNIWFDTDYKRQETHFKNFYTGKGPYYVMYWECERSTEHILEDAKAYGPFEEKESASGWFRLTSAYRHLTSDHECIEERYQIIRTE